MADPKKPSAEDEFFKFLFNSTYYPNFEGHLGRNEATKGVFDVIGDARTIDELRNRVIAKMIAEDEKGNSRTDWMKSAISRFGNFNPDYDFSADTFRKNEDLKNDRRDILGSSGMSTENALLWADALAKELGYKDNEKPLDSFITDVFTGTPELGDVDDYYKSRLSKKMQEKLKSPKARREFYRNLGIAPNNEDYALGELAKIMGRAHRVSQRSDVSEGGKLAGEFIAPYTLRKDDEGLAPNAVDVLFDIGSLPVSIGGNAIKNLPKIEKLGRFAGLPLDNALAKIGIGSGLGAGMDMAHDALDSLFTTHTYSQGEGENDISERGDVGAVLSGEKLMDNFLAGIPAAMMTIRGAKRGGIDTRKRDVKNRKGIKEEIDELESQNRDWAENKKSLVTDEQKIANDKRLNELYTQENMSALGETPAKEKSNLRKVFDWGLVKASMSDPIRNFLLSKGLNTLLNLMR